VLSLDSILGIYNIWNALGLLLNMAQIALFIGTVRRDRQGIKVARWMEEKLIARGHSVYFIDPLELNLPLFDRMYKEMENPSSKLRDLQNKIKMQTDIWR
jgi:NAD(P)H-dependent FMN reductase